MLGGLLLAISLLSMLLLLLCCGRLLLLGCYLSLVLSEIKGEEKDWVSGLDLRLWVHGPFVFRSPHLALSSLPLDDNLLEPLSSCLPRSCPSFMLASASRSASSMGLIPLLPGYLSPPLSYTSAFHRLPPSSDCLSFFAFRCFSL